MTDDRDPHGLPGDLSGVEPRLVKAMAALNCEIAQALSDILADKTDVNPEAMLVHFAAGNVAIHIDCHGLRIDPGPDMPGQEPELGGYL